LDRYIFQGDIDDGKRGEERLTATGSMKLHAVWQVEMLDYDKC
jgi:hypothetical protein